MQVLARLPGDFVGAFGDEKHADETEEVRGSEDVDEVQEESMLYREKVTREKTRSKTYCVLL